MRQIIQIEAVHISRSNSSSDQESFTEVIALCDDGTVWKGDDASGFKWAKLPPIPVQ